MFNKQDIKIGIVIGEHSGDILGSKIIQSLTKEYNISLVGVGGPLTQGQGLKSIFNFKDLHVMGIVEPLMNLRKLLNHRKLLIKLFKKEKIDFFIGVDSPDFNIPIHKALKKEGSIKTIQLVSPSVWSWRQGRLKLIKKYIDLTLCLFKFEHDFYQDHKVGSFLLGHPLSEIEIPNNEIIFQKYSLDRNKKYLAILPGSRSSEISNMMPTYIAFIEKAVAEKKDFHYLIPAVDGAIKAKIEGYIQNKDLPITIAENSARDFLSISKYSIVTSGTATLEAAILGAPPIICYKTSSFNYFIISRMLKTKLIGLPNLLLSKKVFPELLQSECTSENIFNSLNSLIDSDKIQSELIKIKHHLQGDGFDAAAKAIINNS